jgi:hypothetical protein
MSISSINQPQGVRVHTLTPVSPNEPVKLPEWASEPPVVESVEPTECTLGDPDFTVYLTGTGFYEESVIVFAGQDEPTTLEDGKLSTGVNMAMWHGPDTVKVSVRNGPIPSNEVDFTFLAAPPEADANAVEDEADLADPDEMEDEIEAAKEEGDFTPTHRAPPKKKGKR